MESKKIHRAWLILFGCCLLMMTLALLTTVMGFFIKPVSDALGFERSAFTIYYSIAGLIGVFAMPVWGKIIPRIGIKMAVAIGGTGGAFFMFLLGFCRSLPAFYATGLFMGIMIAGITVLPTSILINTWFEEKRGLAMGIAMACSGVGGAVFSPILSGIIQNHGWQIGYMANGVGVFLLTVPVALFILKGSPAELGLKPYGAKEGSLAAPGESQNLHGVPANIAMKSAPFFALAIAVVLINMVASSIQHLPAHFENVGISATSASAIISVVMLVVIAAKVLLGMVNDRFGAITATTSAFIMLALGCLLFSAAGNYKVALIAAMIYGLGMAAVTVIPPLVSGQMFGPRDYSAIYAVIGAMGSLGLALGTPLIGLVFDKTGSYNLALYLCVAVVIVVLALVVYAVKTSKKLWPEVSN